MPRGLEGKVALITGAASGIGRATASRLAQEGCKVIVADIDATAAQAVADDLAEAIAVGADVSTTAGTDECFRRALDVYGTVDLLHANAGILGHYGTLDSLPIEEFDRVMAVNLRSAVLALGSALRIMKEREGGAAVVTASTSALVGEAGWAPYAASKHGMIGLMRSAALEGASCGVRVNAICPGATETGMLRELVDRFDDTSPDDWRNSALIAGEFSDAVPLGRIARAEEVADVVAWLLSPESSYVTGAVVPVDGGLTIT